MTPSPRMTSLATWSERGHEPRTTIDDSAGMTRSPATLRTARPAPASSAKVNGVPRSEPVTALSVPPAASNTFSAEVSKTNDTFSAAAATPRRFAELLQTVSPGKFGLVGTPESVTVQVEAAWFVRVALAVQVAPRV